MALETVRHPVVFFAQRSAVAADPQLPFVERCVVEAFATLLRLQTDAAVRFGLPPEHTVELVTPLEM